MLCDVMLYYIILYHIILYYIILYYIYIINKIYVSIGFHGTSVEIFAIHSRSGSSGGLTELKHWTMTMYFFSLDNPSHLT